VEKKKKINNKNDGEKIVSDPRADCNHSVRGDAKYRYYIITGRTVTIIIIVIIMRRSDNNDDNAPTRPREKTARNDTDDKSNLYITRVEARAKRTHNIK